MKFILLLLLSTILYTAVAQNIVIIPTKIRLKSSNLYWTLNGLDVVLGLNGTEWAIYNNEISPYADDYSVRYNGPGIQLSIVKGKHRPAEKWDVGNDTVCSKLIPRECATASEIEEGGKVIASIKRTDNPKQLWIFESHF